MRGIQSDGAAAGRSWTDRLQAAISVATVVLILLLVALTVPLALVGGP